MPGANPFYWLICGFIVAASVIVAIVAGFGTFGSTYFLIRRERYAYLIALPIGLLAAGIACVLTFWGLLTWAAWADRDPSIPATKPADGELVGTWTLTPATTDKMRSEGGYEISTHSLTLRNDGSFEIVNMPDWWFNFGHSNKGFYSGSGTWRVVKNSQGYWTIEVRFTSLPGYTSGLVTSFYIGQDKSGYYIYDFIGDPDSGDVMMFEKP